VPVNDQYGTLANRDANEVNFTFNEDGDDDATNDTFSASFRLHADDLDDGEEKGGILMNFGNSQPPGEEGEQRSFIDPETGGLAAFTRQDGITVYRDDDQEAPLVGEDGGAVLASHLFFAGTNNPPISSQTGPRENVRTNPEMPELCTECDFMQWGVFAANVEFEDTNDENQRVSREAHALGFWVAGDIPAVGELPFDGSATYSGGAVGTVHTDLFGEDTTCTARGDMDMRWDFGERSGDMKISKFDQEHFEGGLTFKGEMCAPGKTGCSTPKGNHFGGSSMVSCQERGRTVIPKAQLTECGIPRLERLRRRLLRPWPLQLHQQRSQERHADRRQQAARRDGQLDGRQRSLPGVGRLRRQA
jgi:hypothetical protein